MSWFLAPFYDMFMKNTETYCLSEWRETLIQQARGQVLEIGGGTGVNLQYYPDSIEQVIITEPDPGMKKQLDQKFSQLGKSQFKTVDAKAESLPFADGVFDTVVSTLVLCTVQDPAQSLQEIKRVLKPGGQLIFIEHVHAHDNPGRARWQKRLEPVWKRFAGGCHLTRDTLSEIENTGFSIREVNRQSLRKAPSFIRPSIRGIAQKGI